MAAPTALKSSDKSETKIQKSASNNNNKKTDNATSEILIDTAMEEIDEETEDDVKTSNNKKEQDGVVLDESGKPRFQAAAKSGMKVKLESRKVSIPPHRMSPLKQAWPKIYPPLVEHLKLQVRMNLKTKNVELKTCNKTTDPSALQKGADFIKAFSLGFDIDDAIALLRLDDLYIESFEIKDVKTLHGDHLSRAIGRIAGKDGKTKFAIENATRTRIVLADSKIHILGGFTHIRMAREAVMSLILGSPPGKVYGNLRTVASRLKERY